MRHPAALIFLAFASLGAAQPQSLLEGEARAKVVAMLGKFVTWPGRSDLDPMRPFVIGVLGSHPFEDFLDRQIQGLSIRNRKVTVLYLRRPDPVRLQACDMLYICESEEDRLGTILKSLQGYAVLVVGGTAGFAGRGVMLNLPIRDGYLKPEVNLKAVREARLEIHPAFLAKAQAKIVE